MGWVDLTVSGCAAQVLEAASPLPKRADSVWLRIKQRHPLEGPAQDHIPRGGAIGSHSNIRYRDVLDHGPRGQHRARSGGGVQSTVVFQQKDF